MNACEVRLDLDKSRSYRRYRPVVLRRGELGACELRVTVTDHGVELDADGLTPFLVAKMPSGSYYRQSGSWDDSVAVIAVDERYFAAESGRALFAYVELRDDGGEIVATTQDFPLTVLENADGGELPESYDSEIERVIRDADEEVDDAISSAGSAIEDAVSTANDAAQRAIDAAQSFAQGTVVITSEQIDTMFADDGGD